MFEEAKNSVEERPDHLFGPRKDANQPSNRRRAIANKKVGDENNDNYMDYLLTVAEERHRSHLVSKLTDIRHSVK